MPTQRTRSNRAKREQLLKAQNGKCCYCEKSIRLYTGKSPLPRDSATIEHLTLRACGGTNDRDNLALACATCNHARGSVDWLTYKSIVLNEWDYIPNATLHELPKRYKELYNQWLTITGSVKVPLRT